ncbi:MAG: TetR/AcrR family transcriptional regulator [Xanthomonadales bacterium]|nr:HTH-type transcriptional regulator BetI [Xanthomonadales bacterium]MCC6593084.1 TetR/AcrR family transcriptional regulator [Xanthomonadales bacterium]MCE7932253.1 TetR/AcrR family transcriptional regulator [Xanthomonadales bacterium PRO6]
MSAPQTARTEAQRERILAAAQRCFIRHGFHAAGMAGIAEAAGMSPGLIYRYFDSKNAIILAIIERQLLERRAGIDSLPAQPDWEQRIRELFLGWQRGEDTWMNAALFLETSAQATRDPAVASALAAADADIREHFLAWMRAQAQAQAASVDEADLRARALALQSFIEGLAIRAVREPLLEDVRVAAAMRQLLPSLLHFPAPTSKP